MRTAARARRSERSGRRAGAASFPSLACAVAAGLIAPACRGFAPAPEALLARFPRVAPEHVAREAEVTVASPVLNGAFQAVVASRGGAEPAARLQLFGPVGGKVFDLAATRHRFTGYFPHAQIGLDHDLDAAPAPRHLISFVAASLLEDATPLTADRIRGARSTAEGWELDVAALLRGATLVVHLDAAGAISGRDWTLAGASWSERREGPPGERTTFHGGPFTLTVEHTARERGEAFPPDVFQLELPDGITP